MNLFDSINNNAVVILGAVVVFEAIICALLIEWGFRLRARVRAATDAAEEAARAAAMAAPGGLDPEIVIRLLRSGHPVTLEAVRKLTEQQFEAEEALRREALAARQRTAQPAAPQPK